MDLVTLDKPGSPLPPESSEGAGTALASREMQQIVTVGSLDFPLGYVGT